jgi:hypothetical protein
MSALLGTESLADGKQVIVVNQRDYPIAKRQFGTVLPVVGVNGPDTDITPLFGRGVVLIGNDASIHAPVLYTVRGESTIKVIAEELNDLGEWAETPDALAWAKELAFVYVSDTESTESARDSSPSPVTPFSGGEDTDADSSLPEVPAHMLESIPVEALGYPDSSAFTRDEVPSAIEWPEPRDIFASDPVPKLPRGLFADWMEDFIWDVSERQGTEAGYTAIGVIVALASACDDGWMVYPKQVERKWKVRPCLWGVAVGGSSSGKSAAIEAAFEHIQEIDKTRRIEVVQKNKDYERAMKVWQEQEKDYIQKAKKDSQVIFEVSEPTREPDKVLMFSDINVPSAGLFLSAHPRGMLLLVKEWSSFIGNMDAYTSGAGERGYWLSSFDGGPQVVKRIGRGEIVVPNFSACIGGAITPSALRAVLGNGQLNNDGLLQRVLIALGDTQGDGIDREHDEVADRAYRTVLERLIDWDADITQTLRFSSGAGECYAEYMKELKDTLRLTEMSEGCASHFGKIPGMVPRFALTMYLAECAYSNKYPNYSDSIPTGIMERTVQFFHWQETQILAFWRTVIGGKVQGEQAEQKLGLYILAHGSEVLTNRDIEGAIRADWSFPDLSQSARVNARKKILENMNEAGWLSSRLDGARKFQGYSTVHDVNPAVHARFAKLAGDERERRAAINTLLATKRAEAASRRQ